MELKTETYPHNWHGAVNCGICGKQHLADYASVRLIIDGQKRADDLCDECVAEGPPVVARELNRCADQARWRAAARRAAAESAERRAREYEQAAEHPEGAWASLEDLRATRQQAKEYLAHKPPPEPERWEDRCTIPF